MINIILGKQGPNLPPTITNYKNGQIIYHTCVQVLDNSQPRTMIHERRQMNEVNPLIAPGFCLGTVSGTILQAVGSWEEHGGLTELKYQRSEFREAESARICVTKYLEEGSYAERTFRICRGVPLNLLLNTKLNLSTVKLHETK